MDISHILNDLNDAQREAVTTTADSALVLAGAGSGKTRVLVHRIAWLVQAVGISAHSVLAVTFTNKAAAEMRSRIESLLNIPARSMWVGTFHGIAHRLLRAHWQLAGLPEQFQIMDSDDQLRLIKRLMKEMGLDDSKWPPRQVQWFINSKKDDGLRPENIEDYGDLQTRTWLKVYTAYEAACQAGGLVDFAELLLRSHELWLKQPELLKHYQQRFSHILVDEFQDTNAVQYAWLRVLAGQKASVMAVGDDDQSIYGWRGAKIENIRQFSNDFPRAVTIRLEQNYRSTNTILKAANALIANNNDRLGKELWTAGDDGDKINVYAAYNEVDEARFISEQIQAWVDEHGSYKDIAILYRSNAQSRVLEEAMLRSSIPYRIYGGQRFFERAEIKNALAYLRLLSNPADDTAIERVINVPARGIGEKTVQVLRDLAREQQIPLWQSGQEVITRKLLPARALNALQQFYSLIQTMQQATRGLPLHELTDHVIAVSGLIEHHRKEKGEKGRARIENLEELVTATREFDPVEAIPDSEDELSPLALFLDHAALEAGETQAAQYEDSVQMMTFHSAKGLEFPLVFMAGLEQGLFPHAMSIETADGMEEERRLCYVGITRAMKQLYLTYAETRRLHGTENLNRPSRFLKEIPKDLLQEVRLATKISRPVSLTSKTMKGAVPNTELSLGQRVEHSIFGEGVILNYEGQGAQARVQVNFDREGVKWLVVSYAKLQVI